MSKWSSAFRDGRWQKLRLKIMERDGWACKSCGCTGEGVLLNVHHIYYEKNKAPWEYPDDVLITWCDDCHKDRHVYQKKLLVSMSRLNMGDYLSVYHAINQCPDLIAFAFGLTASNQSQHKICKKMNCGGAK